MLSWAASVHLQHSSSKEADALFVSVPTRSILGSLKFSLRATTPLETVLQVVFVSLVWLTLFCLSQSQFSTKQLLWDPTAVHPYDMARPLQMKIHQHHLKWH